MGYSTEYLGQVFSAGDLVDLSEKIEQAQKAAGKTLIGGHCGNCKFYEEAVGHAWCEHPSEINGTVGPDHGCVLWKEKPCQKE